jgi:glycosyltransferase involved in cell wall biosynthesis
MQRDSAWPGWCERLPAEGASARRAEGGTRLQLGARDHSAGARPLVSYVTVVRNGERTLERTLRSVQAQSGPAVEHIVLDGMSTDGTLALIEAHADRIAYFASEPDGGLYEALNKVIPLARGSLICVLNADDWLTADAAAAALRAHRLAGSPKAHLILGAAWVMKPSGQRLWLPGPLDRTSYLRCANICHNAVYATPGAYEASGPYLTNMPIAADFRWLMAAVDAGVPAQAIDDPLVHYSPGGLSSNVLQHTLDCARILGARYPFLEEAEVWGLLHAFHHFRGNLAPHAASRPPHIGRFLEALARRHAAHGDLMATLAQACAQTMQHPEDRRAAGQLTAWERAHRGWRKLRTHLRAHMRGMDRRETL